MKLSQRLEAVAAFVPQCAVAADVGTDHGYIPMALVERNTVRSAIAMDVRKGPLERAKAHIAEAGLTDRIQARLSDGLEALAPGEADCVIIAGMGGELMLHILEAGRAKWDSIPNWVLSPHSDQERVRRFLAGNGFAVRREELVKDEGKFYSVMDVEYRPGAQKRYRKDPVETCSETAGFRYGASLLAGKHPVLKEFLAQEHRQYEDLFQTLSAARTQKAERRCEEIRGILAVNEEAQDEMQ